ncbi:MAG: SGNH/GDSL hydrolase family protein [Planctomycetaceae bacterium]
MPPHISSLLLACLISTGLPATLAMAQTDAETRRLLPELHLLDPPWVSPTIYRESVLLLQENDGEPLVGRLAFPVEELIEVRAADGSRLLKPGTDFQLGSDRRTLQFAATSDLPFVKMGDLFLPSGSPDSYAHRTGHPEQSLMYHPGKWFHSRQFEVTYRRSKAEWPDSAPALAKKHLPRTLELLKSGKSLKLVVAGDSIAAGGDASLHAGVAPHMPAFPELVAAQLQEHYGIPVTLKNLAVGGTSISHGVASLEKYVAEQPDLLIIAFGMNDVGRRDPVWFKAETQKLIDGAKTALPDSEILLVAPMIGNAEWVHTPREMFPKYRDALAELTGPRVALADLTSAWALLLEHKHDLDMTGNGLNHPNDFGHRLYAQTILGLLVPPSSAGQ